jgi:hypothetical protein
MRRGVVVCGRVAIRGAVATADVAAGQADAEMEPPAAGAEAVLATVHLRGKLADRDLVEVGTGPAGHGASVAVRLRPA